jgi:hypothetical protein
MIDFRTRKLWINYGTRIHRGDDRELIKYKVDTFNYISQLEAQIIQLNKKIQMLEKEVNGYERF